MRRLDAVLAMAIRRDRTAVAALEAVAAGDNEPKVSEAAITQLAAMATSPSIESLIRLTADRVMRERAVNALGRLDPAHIDSIAAGLNDARPEVRRAVVDAVSRIKHPRVSELLGKALEDESAAVRLAAVFALRRSGSYGFDRKLAHMVRSDSDSAVRKAAEQALQR
jgi:HEAT repeat protein